MNVSNKSPLLSNDHMPDTPSEERKSPDTITKGTFGKAVTGGTFGKAVTGAVGMLYGAAKNATGGTKITQVPSGGHRNAANADLGKTGFQGKADSAPEKNALPKKTSQAFGLEAPLLGPDSEFLRHHDFGPQ